MQIKDWWINFNLLERGVCMCPGVIGAFAYSFDQTLIIDFSVLAL